jgi:hypothetical protein
MYPSLKTASLSRPNYFQQAIPIQRNEHYTTSVVYMFPFPELQNHDLGDNFFKIKGAIRGGYYSTGL